MNSDKSSNDEIATFVNKPGDFMPKDPKQTDKNNYRDIDKVNRFILMKMKCGKCIVSKYMRLPSINITEENIYYYWGYYKSNGHQLYANPEYFDIKLYKPFVELFKFFDGVDCDYKQLTFIFSTNAMTANIIIDPKYQIVPKEVESGQMMYYSKCEPEYMDELRTELLRNNLLGPHCVVLIHL